MKRLLIAAVVVALVFPSAAYSQAAGTDRLGFSPERLSRIEGVFQKYVDDGLIAGAVALVMRDGQVAHEVAAGWADKEAGRRMTSDAIFRIASQTKAVTSVAVMMLLEEGKLGLNDPVGRYLPSFSSTTVARKDESGLEIVPARRGITILDLLTHTAGISYGTQEHLAPLYEAKGLGPAAGYGWYTADKNEPICETVDRLASVPFLSQPGEAYVYGYNTDILGCLVERVSGLPLDEFVATRITSPLGMKDTHFYLPPAKRDRLTVVYSSGADGRAARAPEGARGQGHYVEGPRRSFAGGAGLVSTARDYARFLQMVLNRGELDGVRLLAPKTVDLMTTNHVRELRSTPGLGFGLGFETVDRFGADGFSSRGSYGWGGAYGTWYRVDPEERLVLVFMIQLLPNRTDIRQKFPSLVYQALIH